MTLDFSFILNKIYQRNKNIMRVQWFQWVRKWRRVAKICYEILRQEYVDDSSGVEHQPNSAFQKKNVQD